MKKIFLLIVLVILCDLAYTQGVSINQTGAVSDTSALLDVSSSSKGVLIPRLSTVERNSISIPAEGLMLFNTDSSCFEFYTNFQWKNLCGFSNINDTVGNIEYDTYPRMIGYGGGLGASSRNIMRNGFQDEDILIMYSGVYLVYVHSELYGMQRRDIRSDDANAAILLNSVVINGSLYLIFYNSSTGDHVIYQYDVSNINAGGTQVAIIGQTLGQVTSNIVMTSDGNDIYLSHNAGNSSNSYEIARYSITGSTSFTYQNTITCSSSAGVTYSFMVDSDQAIYIIGTNGYVYVHDSSGNLVSTEGDYGASSSSARVLNWNNHFYFGRSSLDKIMNRVHIEY